MYNRVNRHTVLFQVHVQNRFAAPIVRVLYRKIVDHSYHVDSAADKMLYYTNVEMHEHYVV